MVLSLRKRYVLITNAFLFCLCPHKTTSPPSLLGYKLCVDDYVVKPFNLDKFFLKIGVLCILFVDYVGTPLKYVVYGLFVLAYFAHSFMLKKLKQKYGAAILSLSEKLLHEEEETPHLQ